MPGRIITAMQDLPDDLKPSAKAELKEPNLQSYIPPDPKADKALNLAYDMLRNPKASTAVPPTKN